MDEQRDTRISLADPPEPRVTDAEFGSACRNWAQAKANERTMQNPVGLLRHETPEAIALRDQLREDVLTAAQRVFDLVAETEAEILAAVQS